MRPLPKLLAFALCFVVALTAQAQQRPGVSVSFHLAVQRYAVEMDPSELQKLANERIAQWLNHKLRFISFESGTAHQHRLVLHLETDPAAPAADMYKSTQLRLELQGPNSGGSLIWPFRPRERYFAAVDSIESFVREVEIRLNDVNQQALVGQMLSKISIADQAKPWTQPLGWVIPSYSKAELCMDKSSLLRFDTTIPTGAGPMQRDYKGQASGDFEPPAGAPSALLLGKLFSRLLDPQDGLMDLGNALGQPALADKVAVRGVFVLEYQRMEPCATATSPEAVRFTGAGR